MNFEQIKHELSEFLDKNPDSEIKEASYSGEDEIIISKPWGDPSIVLILPKNDPMKLINALLPVQLPLRLSAIYHTDHKSLEVLWTAYKLSPANEEVWGREFIFRYDGNDYKCRFNNASDRAIEIASAFRPVGPPDTSYRNLPSFASYIALKDTDNDRFSQPNSFWIEDITLEGDDLISFLANLNFYLSYYDDRSPFVLIHPPERTKAPVGKHVRYPYGSFPSSIVSRPMEPEVLHFWSAGRLGEPASRFLYSYRIIEHAAFFHIDQRAKASVKKALMTPHALDDVTSTTELVIAAVRSSRVDDYARFEHVVSQCVATDRLWDIIEANCEFFSEDHEFDGGFYLPKLIAGASSAKEFENSGIKNFCGTARKIRNALSHGKEERSAAVIAPTSANQDLLVPWAILMARAAGEVILFQSP